MSWARVEHLSCRCLGLGERELVVVDGGEGCDVALLGGVAAALGGAERFQVDIVDAGLFQAGGERGFGEAGAAG